VAVTRVSPNHSREAERGALRYLRRSSSHLGVDSYRWRVRRNRWWSEGNSDSMAVTMDTATNTVTTVTPIMATRAGHPRVPARFASIPRPASEPNVSATSHNAIRFTSPRLQRADVV